MNTPFRIFFCALILLGVIVAQLAAQRGGAPQPQQLQNQMTDGPTVINCAYWPIRTSSSLTPKSKRAWILLYC
jgi:hypothetical protein